MEPTPFQPLGLEKFTDRCLSSGPEILWWNIIVCIPDSNLQKFQPINICGTHPISTLKIWKIPGQLSKFLTQNFMVKYNCMYPWPNATSTAKMISVLYVAIFLVVNASNCEKSCLQFLIPTWSRLGGKEGVDIVSKKFLKEIEMTSTSAITVVSTPNLNYLWGNHINVLGIRRRQRERPVVEFAVHNNFAYYR